MQRGRASLNNNQVVQKQQRLRPNYKSCYGGLFPHFHLAQPQPTTHKRHMINTQRSCAFFSQTNLFEWMKNALTPGKSKKTGENCGFLEDCFTCDIFEASVAAADRHGGGFDQTPEAAHPIQSLLDHQTSVVRPRIPRGRTQRWVGRSRLGRGRGSRRVIAFHHFFFPNTFFTNECDKRQVEVV